MEEIFQFMDIFSNVNLNRNDTEQQIFTKYFNNISQDILKEYLDSRPEEGKSIEVSETCRMTGNVYYKQNDYVKAMTLYTKSLTLAPRDSVEYAITIANRSAVLYELKRYKECLVDIERVFKSEYPKHSLYKIFIRQANCYLELKCYGKASKAVQNAKSSYESAKVLLKKELSEVILEQIKDIEKSLENHSDTDKTGVEDDQEQSSLPELTAGENPCFAYASNTMSMRKNKQRGRHVVASVDIKEGDVLFVEEPYSTSLHISGSSTYFTYCSHCFTSSLTCVPCINCHMLLFCSDQCRHQYWDSRHRWEYAAVRRNIISTDLSLALGVLFRASHTGLNTTIPDNKVYGNKIDNFPYVNQLMTHKNNTISQDNYIRYVKAAVWLVVYLIHDTDYFDWLYAQHTRPYGSLDELYHLVGGLLLKFLCHNHTNTEVIHNNYVARTNNRFGIGLKRNNLTSPLYVSSSALNHACLPNAVTSYHGCVKVVRAITDIKKGTEITECYLEVPDMYMPRIVGDVKSNLKYVELLVNLYKIIFKHSASIENVKMLLKYSMTMVQYSLSLKYKKPGLYKKYLKRTKEVINNTTELLTYHMCQKLAVDYQQNMLRLLHVGDGDFDKAIQLFHYNVIHTQ